MADEATGKVGSPAAVTKQGVQRKSSLPRILVVIHCLLAAYASGVLWLTANTWQLATKVNTGEPPAPILADQIQMARILAWVLLLASALLGSFLATKKGGLRLAIALAIVLVGVVPLVLSESAG